MDEFHFGDGKRGPQVGLDPRLFLVVGGLLAVIATVFVYLNFVSKSGHEVADAQATAVKQIDRSRDREAQAYLRNALVAAKVAFTDTGSYEGVDPATLSAIEPDLHFTDGPSGSLDIVSVATTPDTVALAVLAPSGTCFYIKDGMTEGSTFGSGTTCTGAAAMASAAAASW